MKREIFVFERENLGSEKKKTKSSIYLWNQIREVKFFNILQKEETFRMKKCHTKEILNNLFVKIGAAEMNSDACLRATRVLPPWHFETLNPVGNRSLTFGNSLHFFVSLFVYFVRVWRFRGRNYG